MKTRIEVALTKAFAPIYLNVEDKSESHRGHAGYGEKGESHFDVVVVSDAFAGKTPVARHRLVYDVLDGEFSTTLHALALKTLTPKEYEKIKAY